MLRLRQIQVIAEKLLDSEQAIVRPGDLDEPWRTLYRRVRPLDDAWLGDRAMIERELWRATAGMEGRPALVEAVLDALPGLVPHVPSLQDVAEELPPIDWLWPGWIPRGMVCLLGAAPGAGKSLVALDLARRIIHGQPWPDEVVDRAEAGDPTVAAFDPRHHPLRTYRQPQPSGDSSDPAGHAGCPDGDPPSLEVSPDAASHPECSSGGRQDSTANACDSRRTCTSGRVVYVDAESVPQIQNQRALTWGMDRSRLFLMLPPEPYAMIDFGQRAHQDSLVHMVQRVKPHLVVVDSLSSISARGENSVEDVRELLAFLSTLASEFDVALLVIHHLRKKYGSPGARDVAPSLSIDDFRGSSHIVTVARSVLALSVVPTGPEPDRNAPRRLEVVKTNLCRYPPPLGIVLEGDGPALRYTEPPRPYREPSQAEACADWLVQTLAGAGQPLRSKDVYALAREAGFKRGVVYRARKGLEGIVVDTHNKRSPFNCWKLAAG